MKIAVADVQDGAARLEFMDVESAIKKLEVRVSALYWLAALGVCLFFGVRNITKEVELSHGLKGTRVGSELRLSALRDSPVVITHLMVRGSDESEKRTAVVDPPIANIDSAGITIDVSKLAWKDLRGESVPPPGPETPVNALYFEPKESQLWTPND